MNYSLTHYGFKVALDVDFNEAAVLDIVYRFKTSPKAPRAGWMIKNQVDTASLLGMSYDTYRKIVKRLESRGYMVRGYRRL